MSENYKIMSKFIKDISGETPDIETYLYVKDLISKYQLNIEINSKPLKVQILAPYATKNGEICIVCLFMTAKNKNTNSPYVQFPESQSCHSILVNYLYLRFQ